MPKGTYTTQAPANQTEQKTWNPNENTMKNIEQLRDKMASAVAALENKEISAEEAMAICRAGSVVIGSLRVELRYRLARAEKPRIPFIDANPHRGSEFNPDAI
jgi:flagellin-specific chaperone FliS